MHFLVAESETAEQRERRRASTGQSSGETYADTLRGLAQDATIDLIAPADEDAPLLSPDQIAEFDAVFVTGSPIHVYDDTPQARRQIAFMRRVFASGTPSFGSCAGLQLAAAAAGGTARALPRQEAGIARRIGRTEAGRDHPLFTGRGLSWDAPAQTVTALCDSFTRGRYAHPEENRPITGREAASLQSFPEGFRFVADRKSIARLVGNAVPPKLSYALALELIR